VPAGFADYVMEVRGHGDRFTPYQKIRPEDAALAGAIAATHAELCRRATTRAGELGLARGDRVLIDADAHPDPVDWLLAPLAAAATIVLCGQLDASRLARRVDDERVTVSLTSSRERPR
jgi:acyl-CoA synthetase (AMP-forming)/AMP-acid ligase II